MSVNVGTIATISTAGLTALTLLITIILALVNWYKKKRLAYFDFLEEQIKINQNNLDETWKELEDLYSFKGYIGYESDFEFYKKMLKKYQDLKYKLIEEKMIVSKKIFSKEIISDLHKTIEEERQMWLNIVERNEELKEIQKREQELANKEKNE